MSVSMSENLTTENLLAQEYSRLAKMGFLKAMMLSHSSKNIHC